MKPYRSNLPLLTSLQRSAVVLLSLACFSSSLWAQDDLGIKYPTSTTLMVDPTVASIGTPIVFTSTTSGIKLAGVKVSFFIDDVLVGTNLTDGSSVAKLSMNTPGLKSGAHIARADFAGGVVRTYEVPVTVIDPETGQIIGHYNVTVSDTAMSSSGTAAFTVPDSKPILATQPTNQIVRVDSNVQLVAEAGGTFPLFYQWHSNNLPLPSATNATLILNGVQTNQAGVYSVVVSNSLGSITSSNALISTYSVTTSLSTPQNATVNEGSAVFFAVSANSAIPLSYTWTKDGTNIPGRTAATLALQPLLLTDAGSYSVKISDGVVSIMAEVGSFNVRIRPVIRSQPKNQIVQIGADAQFSAEVDGSMPLFYQWSLNGVPLPTATNTALIINEVQANQAGIYSVAVSNSLGSTISSNASLAIYSVSTSLSPPQNAIVNEGSIVTFEVGASSVVPLSYAWTKDGINIPGQTSATLVLQSVHLTDAGSYAVTISDGVVAIPCQVGNFNVRIRPFFSKQPANAIVAAGSDAIFKVDVGGSGPFYYQWFFNEDALKSQTNAELILKRVEARQTGLYSVVVNNAMGVTTSSNASLAVYSVSTSLSPPQNATVDEGSIVMFEVRASSAVPLTYAWKKDGTNIPVQTTATLTLHPLRLTDAGSYSVKISDGVISVLADAGSFNVNKAVILLSSATSSFDGNLQFSFHGNAGRTYPISVSTNLVVWILLTNLSPGFGPVVFVDPEAAQYPLRFYRIGPSTTPVPITNMVYINPGTFTMGSPLGEVGRNSAEGPQTQVTIRDGFWIGKYEVTQSDILTVMEIDPTVFTGNLNVAFGGASWYYATNYCAKLTARELAAGRLPAGYLYRLPTEAEWEYACRAGTTTRFSYGNDPGYIKLKDYANYSGYNHDIGLVGQKLPNPWGLYDMHGNQSEWCLDWYGIYPGGSVTDPKGPTTGSYRTMRGGNSSSTGSLCRSACRLAVRPDYGGGFRVVLAPGP
jgi:formylglycine-generating enzyme required for sulfatase activity